MSIITIQAKIKQYKQTSLTILCNFGLRTLQLFSIQYSPLCHHGQQHRSISEKCSIFLEISSQAQTLVVRVLVAVIS